MESIEIAVIGAGASGLAAAAALQRRGRHPVVIERDGRVGETWARRYDRLCLHTTRRFSGLPFHPIPRSYGQYVPKDRFAEYLRDYAGRMSLEVRLGQAVDQVRREGGDWVVAGPGLAMRARAVVVATGQHNEPRLPSLPGRERFRGRLLHASGYRSGCDFAGLRVLVVGIGNSGAEIAADLAEHGAARVAVSVRSTPPISAREIAGIPVQVLGMLLAPFPAGAVDRIGAALRRLANGDLTRFGLGPEAWGPFTAKRPAVIDVGFLKQLKAGRIDVLPDLAAFTPDGVELACGRTEAFDVVVCATGFTTGLERILGDPGVLDARGRPRDRDAANDGLFFAGYSETPRGQLFESSRAARGLAAAIDRWLKELT